jgi:hypothetical protein
VWAVINWLSVLLVAGNYNNGTNAGSWYRNGNNNWNNDNNNASFRAAAKLLNNPCILL